MERAAVGESKMTSSSSPGVDSAAHFLGGDSDTCGSSIFCDASMAVVSSTILSTNSFCSILTTLLVVISVIDTLRPASLLPSTASFVPAAAKNGLATTSSSSLDPRYLFALLTAILSSFSTAVNGLFCCGLKNEAGVLAGSGVFDF